MATGTFELLSKNCQNLETFNWCQIQTYYISWWCLMQKIFATNNVCFVDAYASSRFWQPLQRGAPGALHGRGQRIHRTIRRKAKDTSHRQTRVTGLKWAGYKMVTNNFNVPNIVNLSCTFQKKLWANYPNIWQTTCIFLRSLEV